MISKNPILKSTIHPAYIVANIFKKPRYLIFICWLILVIFWLLITLNKPIWRDEAFTILLSSALPSEIISITSRDFSPPFFYILQHYWQNITGFRDVPLRILPLIGSFLTIAIIWDLLRNYILNQKGKSLSNWQYGLAGLIIVLQPAILYFSAEQRAYSWFMALICATVWLSLYLQKKNDWYIWLSLALLEVIIVYTHTVGILWLVGLNLAWLLRWFHLSKQEKFALVFSWTFVALLTSPWLLIMYQQAGQANRWFWFDFDPWVSLREYRGLFTGLEGMWYRRVYKIWFYLSLIIMGIGIIQLWKNKYLRILIFSFSFTVILFYLFSWLATPVLYQRYVTGLAPVTLLFIIPASFFLWEKKIGKLLVLSYLALNCFISFDLLSQDWLPNYKALNKVPTPIYTEEILDIMPCVYYSSSCFLIGNPKDTASFVGVAVLPNIPWIQDWNSITDTQFAVVSRNDSFVVANAELLAKEFLGDGVWLYFFRRSVL